MHAKSFFALALFCAATLRAEDATNAPANAAEPIGTPGQPTSVLVHEARYEGDITDQRCTFKAAFDVEVAGTAPISFSVISGDLVVVETKLPKGVTMHREDRRYMLVFPQPGRYACSLGFMVKATREEPWNNLAFAGPEAVVGSVTLRAVGDGVVLQLLHGTVLELTAGKDTTCVRGFLGAENRVAVRWQTKTTAVQSQALLICSSTVKAHIMPAAVKYATTLQYEIAQGRVNRFSVRIPSSQSVTKVEGEGIRDWDIATRDGAQELTVTLGRPVEQSYMLTLLTEQSMERSTNATPIDPPQPLNVDRESGTIAMTADDVQVETGYSTGIRPINPASGEQAAYQFNARPFSLAVVIRRIEPLIRAHDRVAVRLEDTRVLVTHALQLDVERAGVYTVELAAPTDGTVVDVRGEGVEDWSVQGTGSAARVVLVAFAGRVLGARAIEVQIEHAVKPTNSVTIIAALQVKNAARETARIGIGAAPGIRIQPVADDMAGLCEIPMAALPGRPGETLAYEAEQTAWRLVLAAKPMAMHVSAEVFNLLTIGDGILGGSATIRYAIDNQGVREFRLKVPAHWKNIEFIGPNIRRKDCAGDIWTITLQDKVWGGYTLVVAYDFQFDARSASLDICSVDLADADRVNGHIAIMSAANLEIRESGMETNAPRRGVCRIEAAELPKADSALISRPVLLAFQYAGNGQHVPLRIARFDELPVLEAVADRVQLSTVITESGQLITELLCMIKNNDKHYQRFRLPPDAELWNCRVQGALVKAERDGETVMVPLPRGVSRTTAFPVDLVYVQRIGSFDRTTARLVALAAPVTDVQNTYAEWHVQIPRDFQVSRFGGTMDAAPGTVYRLRDSLREAAAYCRAIFRQPLLPLCVVAVFALGCFCVVSFCRRRWVFGTLTAFLLLAVACLVTISPGLQHSVRTLHAATTISQAAAPTATPLPGDGIRQLLPDMPSTDRHLLFTKVLNLRSEPLTVSMQVTCGRLGAIAGVSGFGVSALLGAGVLYWQWRRQRRRSVWCAAGFTLVMAGAGGILQSARWLDEGIVVAAAIIAATAVMMLCLTIVRRRRSVPASASAPAEADSGIVWSEGQAPAPVVMAVVLLMFAAGRLGAATDVPVREDVEITAATYTGAIVDSGGDQQPAALVEAVLDMHMTQTGRTVRLFDRDVAIHSFEVVRDSSATWWRKSRAYLVRDDFGVGVVLPGQVDVTVKVRFLTPLAGDAARRTLVFAVPPAMITHVALTIAEEDAVAEAPAAITCSSSMVPGTGSTTRIEAVFGGTDRVEIAWTPRVKQAAGMAAAAFCRVTARAIFAGRVLQVNAALDYQVSQGELRTLHVALPTASRLVRVEGDAIRTWRIDAVALTNLLVVELLKGATGDYRLVLETERIIDTAAAMVDIQVPHALDAKRETGMVALQSADDMRIEVVRADEMQKADIGEFSRLMQPAVASNAPAAVACAYQFFRPSFVMTIRAVPLEPQIEADVRSCVTIAANAIRVQARVRYLIKQAGVLRVQMALPDNYQVQDVTGSNIVQWIEIPAEPGLPRTLEVTFAKRLLGACAFDVSLVQSVRMLPPVMPIVSVHPLNVSKLSGGVAITGGEGVQIKSDRFSVVTEVAATALAGEWGSLPGDIFQNNGSILTFKLIQRNGSSPGQPWQLAVSTEKLASWVRAEIVNRLTVDETLLSGRASIRFEIQNAPTREFRIGTPPGARNVLISGADIRRLEQETNQWRIELQHVVQSSVTLTVSWDVPRTNNDDAVAAEGIHAAGVERETGVLAIIAVLPLRAEILSASGDLIRIRDHEAPEWSGSLAEASAVYRYVRPGYALSIAARRYAEAHVLQALADEVSFTSVLSKDGQMMTEMRLTVQNMARQYLEVSLPIGTTNVWSAFVAGQPVRPTVRNGRVLIPLGAADSGGAPVTIEMTYVGNVPFPQRRGDLALATPSFDIPLKQAHWTLYMPDEYRYAGFAGTMQPEHNNSRNTPGDLAQATTSYSFDVYARNEEQTRQSRIVAGKSSISNARARLAEGKLNDAMVNLKQAENVKRYDWEVDSKEMDEIALDLRRKQSQQLLDAQDAFSAANCSGQRDGQSPAASSPVAKRAYEQVAESQVAKVMAGQEVGSAKALPLRVSLPVCGVALSFSQALQTEVNKPLTVSFSAASTGAYRVVAIVLACVVGFGMLWLLVAWCMRLTPQRLAQA